MSQTNLWVTYSGQIGGWSESTLILTNESQSKITRLIRVDQSQASKLVMEDRQGQGRTRTEKVTYRALGSRGAKNEYEMCVKLKTCQSQVLNWDSLFMPLDRLCCGPIDLPSFNICNSFL